VIDALIAQKVDGIIVSSNDANALVPVGKKAAQRGIKVISFDSAIGKEGRIMHLNPSSTPLIGAKQVDFGDGFFEYEVADGDVLEIRFNV
jgi:rhamnose transport system substrate-binding protein